ncbi:MAG: TetR/AcrR family transcriptional regulator [Gemmatimonadales bacterium]
MSSRSPKRKAASASLGFVDYLRRRLEDDPPAQKGERTRARLTLATAEMLEARGYHAMRVADITAAAGLADGSFYVYFKDKREASLAALSTYLSEFVDRFAPLEAVGRSFESIRMAQRRWLDLCRANAGLIRCLFQLGDQEADFARLVERTTRDWHRRVAASMEAARPGDAEARLLAIYLMGSLMDELIRKLIVFPDREFRTLLRAWGADDEAVLDAVCLLWIRLFDPEAPPPDDLSPIVARLAAMMWPGSPRPAAQRTRARRTPK